MGADRAESERGSGGRAGCRGAGLVRIRLDVTHEYLTQNGRVARETIRQSVGGTVLKTETLDFFYDESG